MAHLYASFADASLAEKAAGALLDYGVRQEDLSLVANDSYGQTRATSYGEDNTEYGTDPAVGTVPGTGGVIPGVGGIFPGTGGIFPGAFGVGSTATGYEGGGESFATGTGRGVGVSGVGTPGDLNPLDQGGPDSAVNLEAHQDNDLAAKQGISTTTPEDAGQGAIKGTGIGLGVGILASLAALTLPGVGLILGGGALAAALGATALTAGAGAVAGGVTGYLKEQGVPGHAAERYHGAVADGGAVLSLNLPSGTVDQATAEQVLEKYGAADVGAY